MKQYPADFRDRLLRALDAGLARAEAARTFGVTDRRIRRWQQRRRTTGTVAATPRRGRQRRIGTAAEPALREQALALLRITFGPGGSVAPHTHPGETVFHLAAGTLQFTLHEGEAQLVRAVDGVPAAATPTAGEAIAVGEVITLNAGDTIYYDAAVVQSERNDGAKDAVVLAANLRGVDEPARQFHEDMAASTPAA